MVFVSCLAGSVLELVFVVVVVFVVSAVLLLSVVGVVVFEV